MEDCLFSHRIRWSNTGKNRLFFSPAVQDSLKEYSPLDDVESLLPGDFKYRDVLSRSQFLETDIFLSNYLLSSQGDRVAMGNSLEIRLPFLDYRVIDFASRLPLHWKISGLNEKYILKKTFNGLIPDAIRKRSKQPYRAPISEVFFQKPESDFLEYMVSDVYLKKAGMFDEDKVAKLLSRFRNSDSPVSNEVQNMAVVGILSTQLLYHHFIIIFPLKPAENSNRDKFVRFDS